MKDKNKLTMKIWSVLLILFISSSLHAQTLTVNGKVVDSLGEAIIGASVLVEGTTNGSITDIDGNFTIAEVAPNATLVVSYIGYKTQNVAVKGQTMFNLVLREDTETLEEVVVVGYGVQRKSDLTGSVASVKATEALKNTPAANVSDALQGRISGVSVVGSGDPSQGSSIRVRGVNSISGDAGPLVVIDGFIGGNLKNINPSDIKSIEVLKDASATAVYGSRGANGVILVTTKTPNKETTTVDFNAFVNIKSIIDKPDMLSPGQFAELGNQYMIDNNKAPKYSQQQIDDFYSGKAGYDYFDNIFQTAISQNYDLSVSGKKGNTSYLASMRYENSEGIIRKSLYKQYNWRLKLDTEIKSWVNVGMNLWGDYSEKQGPNMSQYEGLLLGAINFPNTIEPINEKGEYNNLFPLSGTPYYNPMGHINELDTKNSTLNNRIQGYINFKIADGLTFRSQIGINFQNTLNQTNNNSKSYRNYKDSKTSASSRSSFDYDFLNTNTLNYTKEFNANHRINATAVFEQAHANKYMHKATAENLSFPDILGYNALQYADHALAESDRVKTSLMSTMLRVNYALMNRYMITASFRADGSSRLADKWDYFPSVALAWDIKQEKFMQKIECMDQFKLRLGYGSVGNQAIEPYRIYSKMRAVKNPDGTTSYIVDRPAASELKWERNVQINAGLDMSFLNGRITASIDYYNKLSKDVLLEVAQPTHTGWKDLLTNAGEIRNQGVEITVGATPIRTEAWNWSTNLTLSNNKGTFERIPTLDKTQILGTKYEKQLYRMIEGEKLSTFWGYRSGGVWKTEEVNAIAMGADGQPLKDKKGNTMTNGQAYKVVPGQEKIIDVNKDGLINAADQGIIGCGQPTFNWGWDNTVSYRNFDLNIFIVGFHGFDIYNGTRMSRFGLLPGCQTDYITPNPELLNRWTPDNENSNIPGFKQNPKGTIKDAISDRFIENGSFVKVKSITLGYNLPEKLCKKGHINNFRVYASVQNPFFISSYSGLDPEAALGNALTQGADWGAYPNGRNFIFGLNFSF